MQMRYRVLRCRSRAVITASLVCLLAAAATAQSNGTTVDSEEYVSPRPTHQELAERVGSTRVVVSRAIKELLEEEESIRMDGRTLRVRLDNRL